MSYTKACSNGISIEFPNQFRALIVLVLSSPSWTINDQNIYDSSFNLTKRRHKSLEHFTLHSSITIRVQPSSSTFNFTNVQKRNDLSPLPIAKTCFAFVKILERFIFDNGMTILHRSIYWTQWIYGQLSASDRLRVKWHQDWLMLQWVSSCGGRTTLLRRHPHKKWGVRDRFFHADLEKIRRGMIFFRLAVSQYHIGHLFL